MTPNVDIRGAAGNRERVDLTRFWPCPSAQNRELFCNAAWANGWQRQKDFAGELSDPYLLYAEGGEHVRFILKGEPTMAWKTPKIVEVPVGMEINMYACAARK